MKIRKIHSTIGLILFLPFLGWAFTGLIFFIKPGYGGAYELLQPRTYPLDGSSVIKADPAWLEIRCVKTILGVNLMVRTSTGWLHLDPETMSAKQTPTDDEIKALVTDAISANPGRYGNVLRVANNIATTDTGARITLDWKRVSLQQRGLD